MLKQATATPLWRRGFYYDYFDVFSDSSPCLILYYYRTTSIMQYNISNICACGFFINYRNIVHIFKTTKAICQTAVISGEKRSEDVAMVYTCHFRVSSIYVEPQPFPRLVAENSATGDVAKIA
jgi:hypothetical protein